MIRYAITQADLEARVEKHKAGWLARARDRTQRFRSRGRYDETGSIWGEVKQVYMTVQCCKCAYCERALESEKFGKVEHDVEHFRPKGRVTAWRVPAALRAHGVQTTCPPRKRKGYHLLAYHPFNYATACKTCNEILKLDRFPIAGSYDTDGDDPKTLAGERPYLLYPISDVDDDPEDLIDFHGTSPRAASADPHKRNRALVTIAFFRLARTSDRKNLHRDRAIVISALYPLLVDTSRGTPAERARARADLEARLQPRLPHLNCARSFRRLFQHNPTEAQKVYQKARRFAFSKS